MCRMIKEKDRTIEEQSRMMKEKDRTIEEQSRMMKEKDRTIEEQSRRLRMSLPLHLLGEFFLTTRSIR